MGKISSYPEIKEFGGYEYAIFENRYGVCGKVDSYKLQYALSDSTAKDSQSPGGIKNLFYRGKNIGSEVSPTQYSNIKDGKFRGLYLGDYWRIDSISYRIVDFDYWYGTGDTPCNTHHVVVMRDDYYPYWKVPYGSLEGGGMPRVI